MPIIDESAAKTVDKPWGREVWLELNDKYCYKRLYLNKGNRTSYQYHEQKLETNFVISGEAEIWLENDVGNVEILNAKAGDYFTVLPLRKHRVIALTDLVLQEVSTPEVNDVIRIEDDTGRGDGFVQSEHR
jgi:mannose-6-phosphate isomerase